MNQKALIISAVFFMFTSLFSIYFVLSERNISPTTETDNIKTELMKSPASINSSGSSLRIVNGKVYLSWMESRDSNKTALLYAVSEKNEWSEAVPISESDNCFVNFADFPSLVAYKDGTLAAHNLIETGDFAYDINIHISNDKGNTWNQAFVPHNDSTPTEHGFVSMLPYKDDNLMLVWLDGRNYYEDSAKNIIATNKMELRSSIINSKGETIKEFLLDENTCSCCQTDAAITSKGAFVVYRDRTESEIRDMSFVRYNNGTWTKPQTICKDNWKIKGCPVNGPAVDAIGNKVAVAWYTAANKLPKTKVVFSDNAGESFSKAFLICEKETRGNVDLVLLSDDSAIVSWVEMRDNSSVFMARKVFRNGEMEDAFIIAENSTDKPVYGFPKMVESEGILYFTWTEGMKEKMVRTAFLNL